MAKVRWIHISDLHVKSSEQTLYNYKSGIVLDSLWKDIESRRSIDEELQHLDFAFITGDLAWSGGDQSMGDEYLSVYNDVIVPLTQHAEVSLERIFIVPGNHDVALSIANDPSQLGIERQLKSADDITKFLIDPTSQKDKEKVFLRLSSYSNFVRTKLPHIPIDPLTCTFSISIPIAQLKHPLKIVGLNSAWLAHGGQTDKGNLAIGDPIAYSLFQDKIDHALKIVLVHHPIKEDANWYKESEKSVIKNIRRNADILISGHFHETNIASQRILGVANVDLIAGSIYSEKSWRSNSYNYVSFDLATGRGSTYVRQYNDTSRGPEWIPAIHIADRRGVEPIFLFKGSASQPTPPNWLSPTDTDQIEKLGAVVRNQVTDLNRRPLLSESHPDRDSMEVLFPDIYVDPLVHPLKHPVREAMPLSEWLKAEYESKKNILIIGDAGGGKTTSLIEIHHLLANNFLEHLEPNIPLYCEARNYDWSNPLTGSDLIKSLVHVPDELRPILATNASVMLMDALDEAYPRAYRRLEKRDIENLRFRFPHIATCRDDFFYRNLNVKDFTDNYDEILIIEPWTLEREVKTFLGNYFKKIGDGESANLIAQIKDSIEGVSKNPGVPLNPLLVTTFLFLWLYDRNETIENPVTSFAALLDRFVLIWARREISNGKSIIREEHQLISCYEHTAGMIYSNRKKGLPPLDTEAVAQSLGKLVRLPARQLQDDRAILSVLRTRVDPSRKAKVFVTSFTHEVLYELMLARRLVRDLQAPKSSDIIMSELWGHAVNRLARELAGSLPMEDRRKIIALSKEKYRSSFGWLARCRRLLSPSNISRRTRGNLNIIRRHNLCYFWGRLDAEIDGSSICELYADLVSNRITDHVMVISTVGSGVLLAKNYQLAKMYLNSLSANSPVDICNRAYHLVYYGDSSFEDPATFLKDDFVAGEDDWPKTRREIVRRLKSNATRALALRGLDLVTFRRFWETRRIPTLDADSTSAIKHCVDDTGSLDKSAVEILREEHEKLLTSLGWR